MDVRRNVFFKLSILSMTALVFFGYIIGNLYNILIVVTAVTVLACITYAIRIDAENLMWLLCLSLAGISVVYSRDAGLTLKFFLMLTCTVVIKILYEYCDNWQETVENIFLAVSSIHVSATVLYLPFPTQMASFTSSILGSENLRVNLRLLEIGSYAGITGQTGVNAFYITIFIAIVFCRLITTEKRKNLYLFFLAFGILALFLTGKRGALVINVVAMTVLFIIMIKLNKRKLFSYLFISAIIFGISHYAVSNVPEAKAVMDRFTFNSESSDVDITNGREHLWRESIKRFKENPIIGTGANSAVSILRITSHNIYIQLLFELGIVGFCLFAFAFLYSFVKSITAFKRIMNDEGVNVKIKRNIVLSIYIQIFFLSYGIVGDPLYSIYFLVPYIIMISSAKSIYRQNYFKCEDTAVIMNLMRDVEKIENRHINLSYGKKFRRCATGIRTAKNN